MGNMLDSPIAAYPSWRSQMKTTSIVMISFVLLSAAKTIGDAGERPGSSAIIRADGCCMPCPPLCPPDPGPKH